MIKLQNNFTTPEQSKRLLELGVPANSADCFRRTSGTIEIRSEEDYTYDFFSVNIHFTPCWSVGRLMEIYVYLTSYEYVSLIFKKTFTPMDKILDKIEKDIKNGMLDFSKLED